MANRGQSTYLESVRALNAEAVPLVASSNSNAISLLVNWLERHARKMAQLARLGPGASDKKEEQVPKVRLLTLLSFATREEVRWMLLGMVLALLSGLSMPAWLLLLAKSLETFNSIGLLVNTIGGDATLDLLLSELYRLCWLFGIVGGVSLVVGAGYVAIWTYTGEKQALRIREKFVRAAFRQEAAWFDKRGDPQELPTYAANALAKINGALGRQMMDTLANLVSAICCLAVAIGLNAPLVSLTTTNDGTLTVRKLPFF
jgi:ABC-type multidrug transport system fused ATPase/permease subunit